MTTTKKPADRLLQLFVPLMEREGYLYRKSQHRFLKEFPLGKYEFSLLFDARSGLVAVDAGFFVHFDALEKQFKKALGYAVPWSAGATLLNAGAKTWRFWLFDEQFAAMTPVERAAFTSDIIHPQSKIQGCVDFLMQAHHDFAVPLFQNVTTYRDLANFYREYATSGFVGRCRPHAENVVYLWLLLAAYLGDDLDEIAALGKGMKSGFVGHDVNSSIQTVRAHIETIGPTKLFA